MSVNVRPLPFAGGRAARREGHRKFDAFEAGLRARNARQYAIPSPKGIDEAGYATLGGIEQWVSVRGEDRASPVLLFLRPEAGCCG